ncbi:hypothetical protein [Desulfovibrio sp.]|uniref:hypothetical protein n=1 Tax=Desulfovibrio sp. TaxID=885 RepID=UPI0025BEE1AC|nr:hypothetical protein [Desulfovibrio sp.]
MLKKITFLLIVFMAALHMEWRKDMGVGQAHALGVLHEHNHHSASRLLPVKNIQSPLQAGQSLPAEAELVTRGYPHLGVLLPERIKHDASHSSPSEQLIPCFLQTIPYTNPGSLAPASSLHLPDKRKLQESPPPVRAPTA